MAITTTEHERVRFWAEVTDGYRRLRSDPEAWASYRTELATWGRLDLEPLASSAVDEYPEYNGPAGGRQ